MYFVGNSFHVSFKWVVIISTKQETAHTQSAKVSTCYTLWRLVTNNGEGGGLQTAGVGEVKFYPYKRKGERTFFLAVWKRGWAQKVLR